MDYQENLCPSRTVVFAFSSGNNFEFGATLRRLGVAHVLLRSPNEGWYQNGVAGLGSGNAVADYIQGICAAYSRSVTVGLSIGSYGALKYGRLLTDEIIAISPVTGVGGDVHPDFEEKWYFRVHHAPSKAPIRDLKPLFEHGGGHKVRAFVGDGLGTELDAGMAQRIGVKDITVVPGADHAGVARRLRDTGKLAELFQ